MELKKIIQKVEELETELSKLELDSLELHLHDKNNPVYLELKIDDKAKLKVPITFKEKVEESNAEEMSLEEFASQMP